MDNRDKNQARSLKAFSREAAGRIISVLGKISSGSSRIANAIAFSGTEFRDMHVIGPYGISYGIRDGMEAQIIGNSGDPALLGVYDPNRPMAAPGEIIIYSPKSPHIQIILDDNGIRFKNNDQVITML
jgi:hypothetical protein